MATTVDEAPEQEEAVSPRDDVRMRTWLTVSEVADRLKPFGISQRTTYRLVSSGRIPRADFGTPGQPLYRVDPAVLDDFVAEMRRQGGASHDDQPGRQRRRPPRDQR